MQTLSRILNNKFCTSKHFYARALHTAASSFGWALAHACKHMVCLVNKSNQAQVLLSDNKSGKALSWQRFLLPLFLKMLKGFTLRCITVWNFI